MEPYGTPHIFFIYKSTENSPFHSDRIKTRVPKNTVVENPMQFKKCKNFTIIGFFRLK